MDEVKQYILSVIAIVIICGMVQMLFSGIGGSVVKLVAGMIVTIVAVSPILQGNLSLDMKWENMILDSQWAVNEGEDAALDMISTRIKEDTKTYILSKAEEMDASICVDVELDGAMPPMPVAVTLRGTVPPYVKGKLADCISRDLGIGEDQQKWIS